MLRGPTWSAAEIAGTAVLRMVVSSDSMKNATATSHGSNRLLAAEGATEAAIVFEGPVGLIEQYLRDSSADPHAQRNGQDRRDHASNCPFSLSRTNIERTNRCFVFGAVSGTELVAWLHQAGVPKPARTSGQAGGGLSGSD